MKRTIIFIFVITFSVISYSQVTLQAGGGAGIILPSGDYGGSTIDYYNGTKYGLEPGINLHGKVRAGFLGLNIMGELSYSTMRNSGNSEPGKGKVEVKQNVLTFKAGPEFNIDIPLFPIKPYLGANVAINNFSGETEFQAITGISSNNYTLESATRFGLGFDAGAIIKLNPLMSLDVALHYNMMNLIGKTWKDKNPTDGKRIDSYLELNDEKDPLYVINNSEHFISKDRLINSIVITVSLMFGL